MTRSEMMARNSATSDTWALHREYFAQFVTASVKASVLRTFSLETLKASTDKHMNDIPLARWDSLHPFLCYGQKALFDELGEWHTLATTVCVAKEAARQIVEEAR